MKKLIAAALALPVLLTGCATKDFGRMEPMGNLAAMDCAHLAEQQSRVDAFRAKIDEKDDFDARSLVAVTLLDFGYGNMRDKKKALASASVYETQIHERQAAQGCPVIATPPAED